MNDLIEALMIFKKYVKEGSYNEKTPFSCIHDVLLVTAISDKSIVSKEDLDKLDDLGFIWNEEYDCFSSFRFGSS